MKEMTAQERDQMEHARRKGSVLSEVSLERHRQDQEWGGPQHDDQHTPDDWVPMMKKFLARTFTFNKEVFRRSMIQIAALAVAAVEWLDRAEEEKVPQTIFKNLAKLEKEATEKRMKDEG